MSCTCSLRVLINSAIIQWNSKHTRVSTCTHSQLCMQTLPIPEAKKTVVCILMFKYNGSQKSIAGVMITFDSLQQMV